MESLRTFNFVSRLFHLLVFTAYFSQLLVNPVSQARSDLTEGSSYFFYQHPEYPRDCQEILSQCSATKTVTSGVYLIKPDGYPQPFEVSCDNSNESGGWTVIQRRFDGSIDFGRSWEEYKDGFGFLSTEFWLGIEKVSYLTNQKTYELQIDMVNAAGLPFYVNYDQFRISDDWGEFKLASFGEYSGNASNSMGGNYPFTTHDRDNDRFYSNCAQKHRSGWWYPLYYYYYSSSSCYRWYYYYYYYYYCTNSNLNGDSSGGNGQNIFWRNLPRNACNIRRTEMKIRPI